MVGVEFRQDKSKMEIMFNLEQGILSFAAKNALRNDKICRLINWINH